jgi:hypothetical protein
MAHSLSKVARCNGHTTGELAVSVAQHCVLSCRAAPFGFKFEALMHDAAECVTGDITTPLKQLLADFIRIEKNIEHSIRGQYLLPLDMTKDAKAVDLRMAATEKRDVMPKDPEGDEWETIKGIALRHLIDPWEPGVAKARWLDAFKLLWPAHKALKEAEARPTRPRHVLICKSAPAMERWREQAHLSSHLRGLPVGHSYHDLPKGRIKVTGAPMAPSREKALDALYNAPAPKPVTSTST